MRKKQPVADFTVLELAGTPWLRVRSDGSCFVLERYSPPPEDSARAWDGWGQATYHIGLPALAARLLREGVQNVGEVKNIEALVQTAERNILDALEHVLEPKENVP